jgi:patatin-like phospholipase
MTRFHHHLSALVLGATLLSAGCATPKRLEAVPRDLQDRAQIPGMAGVRSWGDRLNAELMADLSESVVRERKALGVADDAPLPPTNFIAISGGGANGAFGAGLLCGWSEAGNRPQFKVVTGISTGALTAPFAFLGTSSDPQLREVYTTLSTKDICEKRSFMAALWDDALADNKPLCDLLPKYVDEKMMKAIADEYHKGRLLMISTTDLDALRPVVWNIGKIAASGDPHALELIRKVMIASAAIPGAFPPVMIDVDVDGKHYQEMHVDGGATAQVFLYPPSFSLVKEAASRAIGSRERHVYVIRNSRLDPEWSDTNRLTLDIVGRAVGSLIQTQGVGDLYQLMLCAKRDKTDLNIAFIPASFQEVPKEAFDKEYMNKLFNTGYEMARKGYQWSKSPPGYTELVEPTDAGASSGLQ